MVLDRRRILETSLFDLEQVVTVQYLSRHSDLPIDDAKRELAEFLKQNRDRTELHAVYVLSGERKVFSLTSSSSDTKLIRKWCTQLVRDCDLEEVRRFYSKVETCEIYCLHTKPIKEGVFVASKAESAAKKKRDIASFVGAATQSKQEVPLLNNVSQKGQNEIGLKADTMSGNAIKHRGERIIIASTVPYMKEEVKSQEITGERNVVTKSRSDKMTSSRKKNVTLPAKNTFLTEDDLFSDEDSNPEKMDEKDGKMDCCNETKKIEATKERENPEKLLQLSGSDGSRNGNSQEGQKRMTRKEYVAETFLDSDGFMVTKQVLKEVEIEPQPTDAPTEIRGKTLNTKLLDNKKQKNARIPQGQAKISSFFLKK
uniref:DNA polymerase delta subunit 3 n=1 Tax=Setaria digitata TaxID=48799 RepID=A0A915PU47_9BILA